MRHTALLAFAALLVPAAAHAAPDPEAATTPETPPAAETTPEAPPVQGSNRSLGSSLDHFYLSGRAGATFLDLPPLDYGVAGNKAIEVEHDAGWDVDGSIGYDFGAFRIEAEVGYRQASIKSLTTHVPIPIRPITGAVFSAPAGTFASAGGTSSALSFMVNGLLDFGDEDGLNGFIGAGAGVGRIDYNNIRLYDDAQPTLDDGRTTFAWQVIGGIRHPLSEHVDIDLRFDFFQTSKLALQTPTGIPIDTRFRSSSVTLGFTFDLGR